MENIKPDKSLTNEIALRSRSKDALSFGNLPNPDPVLKKMRKDIEVYQDLLSDSKVESAVVSRRAGVLGLEWDLDRGREKVKNIDFFREMLEGIELYDVITEGFDGVLYGYKPAEIIWTTDSGKWIPQQIIGKPPEWFEYNGENELLFRNGPSTTEPCHPTKFLQFRNGANYKNPYGIGILSRVFWPATFKKNGWKFWNIFAEKYGMPWLIGKFPRGTTQTEINELLNTLESMVQDAIGAIPDDNSVELKSDAFKASGSSIYQDMIQLAHDEIALAIVGQTLTSEVNGGGSYAASSTHMAVKQEIVMADKRVFESEINKLLKWVALYNFGDEREAPKFAMFEEEDINTALAERDSKLILHPGFSFTAEYYQKAYGLEESDFQLTPPVNQNPAQFSRSYQVAEALEARSSGVLGYSRHSDFSKSTTDPVASVEKFAEDAVKEYNIDPIMKPVMEMIAGAESYEELEKATENIYPDMDSETLTDELAKALFIAESMGIEV